MKDLKIDFGAAGDEIVDDTASVQAGLQWAATNRDVLYIPRGFYKVTSQITVTQGVSFKVYGDTRQGANWHTALRWRGPAGGTMLLLDGCRDIEWSDFGLDAPDITAEPEVLLDIDKIAAGSWQPRKNSFRRMLLRGGTLATVRISNTVGVNNEANLFEECNNNISGARWGNGVPGGPIGYWVKHVNAKNNQVVGGEINGKEAAIYNQAGSIHATRVEISQCGTWVRHAGNGEPCNIHGCDGDSSKTFLEMVSSQTGPVVATGCRFYPHYDGPVFVLGDTIGPLILQGNEFANGGYKATASTQITANGPNVIALGNTFPNDQMLPVPGTAVPKLRSLYALGNMHYSAGNVRNLSNDYLVPFRTTGASTSSLQIGGTSGFRGELQGISAVNESFNSNQPVIPFSANAPMTLTSLPCIRSGLFEGQQIKLVNRGAYPLSLIDSTYLLGTGVALTSPTITIPSKGSVDFIWTFGFTGKWLQTSPVVAPL